MVDFGTHMPFSVPGRWRTLGSGPQPASTTVVSGPVRIRFGWSNGFCNLRIVVDSSICSMLCAIDMYQGVSILQEIESKRCSTLNEDLSLAPIHSPWPSQRCSPCTSHSRGRQEPLDARARANMPVACVICWECLALCSDSPQYGQLEREELSGWFRFDAESTPSKICKNNLWMHLVFVSLRWARKGSGASPSQLHPIADLTMFEGLAHVIIEKHVFGNWEGKHLNISKQKLLVCCDVSPFLWFSLPTR